jgi:hypothetical protein
MVFSLIILSCVLLVFVLTFSFENRILKDREFLIEGFVRLYKRYPSESEILHYRQRHLDTIEKLNDNINETK